MSSNIDYSLMNICIHNKSRIVPYSITYSSVINGFRHLQMHPQLSNLCCVRYAASESTCLTENPSSVTQF